MIEEIKKIILEHTHIYDDELEKILEDIKALLIEHLMPEDWDNSEV